MNKFFTRTLSVLLVAVMLVSALVLPASAALTYRTGGNSVSSSYKNGRYYTNFTKLTLCDDDRNNLLAVAISQLGYQEGPSAGSYSGTVASSGNYTEFNYNAGNWLGSYSYAWCASFVSWSLFQSRCTDQKDYNSACRFNKGKTAYIWKEYSCTAWVNQLTGYTSYYKKSAARGGSYTPIYGDIIFFKNSQGPCHVGIVVYVSGNTVYTIEGNTSPGNGVVVANGGGVYFKSYDLSKSSIHGYARLPFKNTDNVSNIDYSGKKPTAGLYMTNGEKSLYKSASSSSTEQLVIPAYRMIEVTEVSADKMFLKTTYNGTTGWVYNSSSQNKRVIQITKNGSSSSSDSTTTPPVTDNGSLVAGKPHTITGSYPKSNAKGSGLTDGVYSNDIYDGTWLALNDNNRVNGYAHFDYDLLKRYTLTDAKIHVAVVLSDGVDRPYDMQIEVSDDKTNWTEAGVFSVTAGAWANGTYTFSAKLSGTGRYIRIKAVNSGLWYVNEIVVNGVEAGSAPAVTNESIVAGKTPTYYGTTSYNAANKITDGVYSNNVYDGTWLGLGTKNIDPSSPDGAYTWFQFNLDKVYSLTGAKIHLGASGSDDGIGKPYEVHIRVSMDGTTWSEAAGFVTKDADWTKAGGNTFSLDAISANAKYVRVYAMPMSWFFISEFELYGEEYVADTRANILKGIKPVLSGDGTSKYLGNGLTDGKYSSDWSDGTWVALGDNNKIAGTDYVALDFDLTKRYTIDEVSIHFARIDNNSGIGRPYDVHVQVSDDNVNWNTLGSFDLPVGDALIKGYHTFSISNLVGAGRYVRFTGIPSGMFFINEVVAYGAETVDEEPVVPPVENPPVADEGTLGDVDGNNIIDADDYITLKRIYFGTAKIESLASPESAIARCDVNKDGKLDADDYITLKRVYFGTATLG